MKLYKLGLEGVRKLPQSFLLEYCRNNDAGIWLDIDVDVGILYTGESIQIYRGEDKIRLIKEKKMEEMDVKELLK
jgi:hypothetical protein